MNVNHDYEMLTPRTVRRTDSEELLEFPAGCIAKLEYCVDGETQTPGSDRDSVHFVRWAVYEKPSPAACVSSPGEVGAFLLSGLGADRAQAVRDMIVLLATLPAFITSVF